MSHSTKLMENSDIVLSALKKTDIKLGTMRTKKNNEKQQLTTKTKTKTKVNVRLCTGTYLMIPINIC